MKGEQYLGGVITVEPSYLEYAAFVTGNTALWALGSTPREAIGNLVMTHPEEIIKALALTASNAEPQAPEPPQRVRCEDCGGINVGHLECDHMPADGQRFR